MSDTSKVFAALGALDTVADRVLDRISTPDEDQAAFDEIASRVNAVVAGALVVFAAKLGIVLDPVSVLEAVAIVAGFLGLGEATRSRVRPA